MQSFDAVWDTIVVDVDGAKGFLRNCFIGRPMRDVLQTFVNSHDTSLIESVLPLLEANMAAYYSSRSCRLPSEAQSTNVHINFPVAGRALRRCGKSP